MFSALFTHGFHQMNAQKTEQQRPDHILVHRIEPGSAVHQVERHFREHGKQRKAQGVFPEAGCENIPSTAMNAKMGKASRPAHVSQSCAGRRVAQR